MMFYKWMITTEAWLEGLAAIFVLLSSSPISLCFLLSPSSRPSMQWACLSCRSASGKTLLAFYRAVSAVTSSPAGDSDVHKVTSVTPTSGSVWRSTRLVWHQRAHVRLVLGARRCWAGTPTSCVITGPKQVGSSSHSNTPGRSVQLPIQIMLWLIQSQHMSQFKGGWGGGVISQWLKTVLKSWQCAFCASINGGLPQSQWL